MGGAGGRVVVGAGGRGSRRGSRRGWISSERWPVSTKVVCSVTPDLALLVTHMLHASVPWHHTAAAILEWVLAYFMALFPLTYHNELRRGTGSPGGVGQEETHLLDAEQLVTGQNQYS